MVGALGVHPHGVQGLWGEKANRDPPLAGGGAGAAWSRARRRAGRVLELDCMHGQSPVSLGGWQDMD